MGIVYILLLILLRWLSMKILTFLFKFTLKAIIVCLALFGLIIILAASTDIEAAPYENTQTAKYII